MSSNHASKFCCELVAELGRTGPWRRRLQVGRKKEPPHVPALAFGKPLVSAVVTETGPPRSRFPAAAIVDRCPPLGLQLAQASGRLAKHLRMALSDTPAVFTSVRSFLPDLDLRRSGRGAERGRLEAASRDRFVSNGRGQDWHSPANSKSHRKKFQLSRAKTRSFQKIAWPNEQPASQTMSRWD